MMLVFDGTRGRAVRLVSVKKLTKEVSESYARTCAVSDSFEGGEQRGSSVTQVPRRQPSRIDSVEQQTSNCCKPQGQQAEHPLRRIAHHQYIHLQIV